MTRDDCRAGHDRLSPSPLIRSAWPRCTGREVEERGMSFQALSRIEVNAILFIRFLKTDAEMP
jgi:hypothetical protein